MAVIVQRPAFFPEMLALHVPIVIDTPLGRYPGELTGYTIPRGTREGWGLRKKPPTPALTSLF